MLYTWQYIEHNECNEENPMRDFAIMTDSCCDLTADEVRALGVSVLPISFTMGGRTMRDTPDHADMSPAEFFERIAAGESCTTAASGVGEYAELMKTALDEGKDVLFISFAAVLSTMYQSACIAAKDLIESYPDAKIMVGDSLSGSRGQGMLVYAAVQEQRKGKTLEEVAEFAREGAKHMAHWFVLADLNHLKRTGRINAAAATVGTMLHVKPVLHIDEEGHLEAAGKVRGAKAALGMLLDYVEKTGIDIEKQTVFLAHTGDVEQAELLGRLVRERFGVKETSNGYVGPVVGSHIGTGGVGLFFFATER